MKLLITNPQNEALNNSIVNLALLSVALESLYHFFTSSIYQKQQITACFTITKLQPHYVVVLYKKLLHRYTDRDGLLNDALWYVARMWTIDQYMMQQSYERFCANYPKPETCTTFHCGKQDTKHNIHLVTCILYNPLLCNYGKWQTDRWGRWGLKPNYQHKQRTNLQYPTFVSLPSVALPSHPGLRRWSTTIAHDIERHRVLGP